jgi:major membrane immunogen (membrane-anchored lipoprotein)
VTITLKGDKITNAKITGYTTHYPISYIDPILPQELLQRQDIDKIDVISGATLSTYDFYYAVKDALQQAEQAQQMTTSKTGK